MSMNVSDYDVWSQDINPIITSTLRSANLINHKKILSLSVPDIERLSGLTTQQILSLKNIVASKFVPVQRCSALDILRGTAHKSLLRWKLSTECINIDSCLRGGLLSGLLTEVVGESASGKTQLCLQVCISAQLQGKGAVYICTEDVFPSKRLQQMIQHHSRRHNRKGLGNGIFIEHVPDFETLDFCVSKRLPTLLNRGEVSVVVIDSVAALFRCHYDSTQMVERAEHLIRFAAVLHNFASEHNIPIICVNQVTAGMQSAMALGTPGNLIPSLGLTWANQIHCRIAMAKPAWLPSHDVQEINDRLQKQSPDAKPTWRSLKVSLSPHVPPSEIIVYIDNAGIHGVDLKKS